MATKPKVLPELLPTERGMSLVLRARLVHFRIQELVALFTRGSALANLGLVSLSRYISFILPDNGDDELTAAPQISLRNRRPRRTGQPVLALSRRYRRT